mmetsp:Transcript_4033/g.12633  ORF Transcript_4033/g.12633 Transcript_4033/m.12633 type:complete len:222 (-) Transcript_4033:178-843(-)
MFLKHALGTSAPAAARKRHHGAHGVHAASRTGLLPLPLPPACACTVPLVHEGERAWGGGGHAPSSLGRMQARALGLSALLRGLGRGSACGRASASGCESGRAAWISWRRSRREIRLQSSCGAPHGRPGRRTRRDRRRHDRHDRRGRRGRGRRTRDQHSDRRLHSRRGCLRHTGRRHTCRRHRHRSLLLRRRPPALACRSGNSSSWRQRRSNCTAGRSSRPV